ncbi:MAG: thioredoxin family protein [Bernardetiaceae bacterium]|jgi:thiol:disulfide interchange protein DsbD|nr:thioredoxin family protein [Bernardetiaceae bacterium]
MKKIVFGLVWMAWALTAQAQVLDPASWAGKPAVAEAKIGDVVELVFSAQIEGDWYMYSNDFDPNLGPNLTAFTFAPHPSYELVGKPQAVNAKKKFDKIWEGEVTYFVKTAEFRQKVKVLAEGFLVKATVEYQLCSDLTGQCLPPTEKDVAFALKVLPVGGTKSPTTEVATNKTAPADAKLADSKPTEQIVAPNPVPAGQTAPADDTTTKPVIMEKPQAASDQVEVSKASLDYGAADSSAANGSLVGFFIAAFLSGLVALLTPCVFPMIPMTVSFFLKNSENRAQAISKGLVFGLSIMAIFIAIGSLFSLAFGADAANLLATHWLPNLLFFAIFIVFALSFFGLFEITLPSGLVNKMDQQSERGGYLGVFFMAFTLALVSFSCTGPIAGSVLVQSANGEFLRPMVGMAGFSLAFALPFSLFAIFPSWMQNLPKSGGWLNSVKVVLGFVELALALKFLSVVDQVYHWGILDRHVYIALWAAIGTGLGLYLLGKIQLPHDSPVTRIGVGRLLLALATFSFVFYLVPGLFGAPLKALAGYLPPQTTHDFDLVALLRSGAGATVAGETTAIKAKYSDRLHLPHGLQGYFEYNEALAAAQASGKPLFIDFTGHGCVNCREMEANVWSDPAVLQRLRNDFTLVALYVDDPLELPEKEWITSARDGRVKKTIGKINADFQITRFNNNAQPFYLLLDHQGQLLVPPKAYDLNVGNFVKFLDAGLAAFEKQKLARR